MTILALVLCLQEAFCSEEEALEKLFPAADRFVRGEVALDAEARADVEGWTGSPVEERHLLVVAVQIGVPAGYAIVTEEIMARLPVTFVVGVDLFGRVIDVHVLVHWERKTEGFLSVDEFDCTKRRFLDQLRGKTLADPIRGNKDVVTVTGAEYSCKAILRGTRKALAVVHEVCFDRPEIVRRPLLERDK